MNRNQFIEKIHSFNHNVENDYQTFTYFPKDSYISVKLDEGLEKSIENLKNKLDKFLKENFEYELNKTKLVTELIDKKSIINSGDDGISLSITYNKLYDFLINDNVIKNNNKVKILRLEDSEGNGLYKSMEKVNNSISDSFDFCGQRQPSPMEDGVLSSLFSNIAEDKEKTKSWFFGYKNKGQILRWIDNEGLMDFIIEKNKDMFVVEYDVLETDLITTNKQVAFMKKKSIKISSFKLENLKKEESFNLKEELIKKLRKENKKINKLI
jgi:hypothetical protein